jgi:hypothetical protein
MWGSAAFGTLRSRVQIPASRPSKVQVSGGVEPPLSHVPAEAIPRASRGKVCAGPVDA